MDVMDDNLEIIPSRKYDELMLDWLSIAAPSLQQTILNFAQISSISNVHPNGAFGMASSVTSASALNPSSSPPKPRTHRAAVHHEKENCDPNPRQLSGAEYSASGLKISRPSSPLTPSKNRKKKRVSTDIPQFYFPRAMPSGSVMDKEIDSFRSMPSNSGPFRVNDLIMLLLDSQIPSCVGSLIFKRLDLFQTGTVEREQFYNFWKTKMQHPDVESRIFNFLKTDPNSKFLYPEDFKPLLKEILVQHPGLEFLRGSLEFQERYTETAIVRIFYRACRTKRCRLTLEEFRSCGVVQALQELDADENINTSLDFFSYEHFYVIYCKFWELDTDHDLLLSPSDLAKYGNFSLSSKIVQRIFQQPPFVQGKRSRVPQHKGCLGYQDFVWFILSEEDKNTDTASQFWFQCVDTDMDGVLSTWEMEYFYEEQMQRLERMHFEPIAFEDILCQLLDIVKPKDLSRISLQDIKLCKQGSYVFNLLFNASKFLACEDPSAERHDTR